MAVSHTTLIYPKGHACTSENRSKCLLHDHPWHKATTCGRFHPHDLSIVLGSKADMNRQIVAIEIQAIKGCISHDPLRAGAKLRSTLERGNDQRACSELLAANALRMNADEAGHRSEN